MMLSFSHLFGLGRNTRMHTYDVDALLRLLQRISGLNANVQMQLVARTTLGQRATAQKTPFGSWLSSVVGARYRVTEGHVVRADGRKSKQFDIIIVWDSGAETLYGSRPGEPELVRAECVAAVGEVKSSWYDHNDLIRSFSQTVDEIEYLQEGLLVENRRDSVQSRQYPNWRPCSSYFRTRMEEQVLQLHSSVRSRKVRLETPLR